MELTLCCFKTLWFARMYILFDRSQKSSKHWNQNVRLHNFEFSRRRWVRLGVSGSTLNIWESRLQKTWCNKSTGYGCDSVEERSWDPSSDSPSEHRVHIRSPVHITRHRSVPRVHAVWISGRVHQGVHRHVGMENTEI